MLCCTSKHACSCRCSGDSSCSPSAITLDLHVRRLSSIVSPQRGRTRLPRLLCILHHLLISFICCAPESMPPALTFSHVYRCTCPCHSHVCRLSAIVRTQRGRAGLPCLFCILHQLLLCCCLPGSCSSLDAAAERQALQRVTLLSLLC